MTFKATWEWRTYLYYWTRWCQTSDDDDWLRTIICFCIVLITDEIVWLANFVEQHLAIVPYEYASISLVVIEASMWLL